MPATVAAHACNRSGTQHRRRSDCCAAAAAAAAVATVAAAAAAVAMAAAIAAAAVVAAAAMAAVAAAAAAYRRRASRSDRHCSSSRGTTRSPDVMHYAMHFEMQRVMHFATRYAMHYAMHCVMRYAMHYAMHYVMHYVGRPTGRGGDLAAPSGTARRRRSRPGGWRCRPHPAAHRAAAIELHATRLPPYAPRLPPLPATRPGCTPAHQGVHPSAPQVASFFDHALGFSEPFRYGGPWASHAGGGAVPAQWPQFVAAFQARRALTGYPLTYGPMDLQACPWSPLLTYARTYVPTHPLCVPLPRAPACAPPAW